MAIHMATRSVIRPWGIVKDILVKIGKFDFPIDFVVLVMKEDKSVPIILGHPLLNTTHSLVDIRESKHILWVGDEEMTFGLENGFKEDYASNEVFNLDDEMSSTNWRN